MIGCRVAGCAALAVAVAGCFPSLEDRPWLVDETRILAVRGTPAEQRPNQPVAFEALVVSPAGTVDAAVQWAVCLRPRTADERTGVSAACARGEDLMSVDASTAILSNACARFGPNPPPSEGDEPPRRPADPDPSGGYFLPVRAEVTGDDGAPESAFGFQRIRCDLAGATRAVFDEYQDRYFLNEAPAPASITGVDGDGATDELRVAAGRTLTLRAEVSDDAVEPFVIYNVDQNVLFDATESLRIAWYVTGGTLGRATETLAGDDIARGATFDTAWTAPDAPQTVHGWAVLRDSRGGVTWSEFDIAVQ